MLQFLQNPEFLKDNVPTWVSMEHLNLPYSRTVAGEAFSGWAKPFLGLLVPADNPFWTATENEGAWEKELAKREGVQ